MTIGRRNFIVGCAGAIAAGTPFGRRLSGQAPGRTPADFFTPDA